MIRQPLWAYYFRLSQSLFSTYIYSNKRNSQMSHLHIWGLAAHQKTSLRSSSHDSEVHDRERFRDPPGGNPLADRIHITIFYLFVNKLQIINFTEELIIPIDADWQNESIGKNILFDQNVSCHNEVVVLTPIPLVNATSPSCDYARIYAQ